MVVQVLLTGIWGGLLALERRAFLQAMLSRPLVAATGTGIIFSDLETGLFVGVFFELLHLAGASLGGAHPDDELLPAATAAAMASAMSQASGAPGTPAVWTVAILICAPLGRVGRIVEFALDVRAKRYLGRARDATIAGEMKRAARQNLRAMWPHFAVTGLLCAVAALLGAPVGALFHLTPPTVLRGLGLAYPVLTVVAASIAVIGVQAPRRNLTALIFAIAGALAAVLSGRAG